MSAPFPGEELSIQVTPTTITTPMLLGHLFNWLLFGVLALQVYIYGISFPRDKPGLKVFVYFTFFLDALQTAFATHYAWYFLASGWGNMLVLDFAPWTAASIPPLTGLIALLAQGFSCWRIGILAQGNRFFYIPVMGLIGVTAIGSCISALYIGIIIGRLRDISKVILLEKPVIIGWLSSSMACDLVITFTLVWQLFRRRNEGFKSINLIVHRAIRMTIETGALSTFVSVVKLALYLSASTTNWCFMFGMFIGKLYSNSLLASLNSRSPTFQTSPSITNSVGVDSWDVQTGSSAHDEEFTSASFPDIPSQKSDIELGIAQ